MPVFGRIRRVVKFRHRSFQRYQSHQKIFIELGDTALQSWTHFGKIQNSQTILSIFGRFLGKSGKRSMGFEWKSDNAKFLKWKKSFWFYYYSKNRFIELVLHLRILYRNSNGQKILVFRFFDFFIGFSLLFGWVARVRGW